MVIFVFQINNELEGSVPQFPKRACLVDGMLDDGNDNVREDNIYGEYVHDVNNNDDDDDDDDDDDEQR